MTTAIVLDARATLARQLRAALDRTRVAVDPDQVCACAECRRRRRAEWVCRRCGYDGVMVIARCTWVERHQRERIGLQEARERAVIERAKGRKRPRYDLDHIEGSAE